MFERVLRCHTHRSAGGILFAFETECRPVLVLALVLAKAHEDGTLIRAGLTEGEKVRKEERKKERKKE